MKVRILRIPPARALEGVDLGPSRFETGHIYELDARIANVLILWDCAESVDEDHPVTKSDKQFR